MSGFYGGKTTSPCSRHNNYPSLIRNDVNYRPCNGILSGVDDGKIGEIIRFPSPDPRPGEGKTRNEPRWEGVVSVATRYLVDCSTASDVSPSGVARVRGRGQTPSLQDAALA